MNNVSYLSSNAYRESLELLSKEKPKTTPNDILSKSQKTLERIKNTNVIKIVKGESGDFYEAIHEAIRKLSLVRPGRKLLKLLSTSTDSIKFAKQQMHILSPIRTRYLYHLKI